MTSYMPVFASHNTSGILYIYALHLNEYVYPRYIYILCLDSSEQRVRIRKALAGARDRARSKQTIDRVLFAFSVCGLCCFSVAARRLTNPLSHTHTHA